MTTDAAAIPISTEAEEDIGDWEEWDGSSPFLHHCIAGSIAGVAEHTLLYPVDNIKTHMQSYCASCPQRSSSVSSMTKKSAVAAAAAKNASSSSPKTSSSFTSSASAKAPVAVHGHPHSIHHHAHNNINTSSMWHTMRHIVHNAQHHHHYPTSGGSTWSTTSASAFEHSTLAVATTAPDAAAASSSSSSSSSVVANPFRYLRLWRGVQSMFAGCIPAHASYFSSYEMVKHLFLELERNKEGGDGALSSSSAQPPQLSTIGSSTAGAVATIAHDMIMSPLDTIKQRMQLGQLEASLLTATRNFYASEGFTGLYRSFPITLMTNVPYGMIMVTVNEFLKQQLSQNNTHHLGLGGGTAAGDDNGDDDQPHNKKLTVTTCLISGSAAGLVAAALTTPLDRVKTRLQTKPLLLFPSTPTTNAAGVVMSSTTATTSPAAAAVASATAPNLCSPHQQELCHNLKKRAELPAIESLPRVAKNWQEAFKSILAEEGPRGFFRGMTPRLVTHTPAVAISWTTYETAKQHLAAALL